MCKARLSSFHFEFLRLRPCPAPAILISPRSYPSPPTPTSLYPHAGLLEDDIVCRCKLHSVVVYYTWPDYRYNYCCWPESIDRSVCLGTHIRRQCIILLSESRCFGYRSSYHIPSSRKCLTGKTRAFAHEQSSFTPREIQARLRNLRKS